MTLWTAAHQAPLSFTISWSFLKLLSIELVMLPNHLIFCCPLLLLPSIYIRWPKYWSFSFSISPSGEYSGLISLLFKGLSSLLQHHSLKASLLQCSAFFMVKLSHLYLTTGKMIALTIWTFVGKVMSLLFNTQSRFFTAFLPRSKCLLISWLQSLQWFWSPRKENLSLSIYFYFFPSVCHEVMGPDAIILVFWM